MPLTFRDRVHTQAGSRFFRGPASWCVAGTLVACVIAGGCGRRGLPGIVPVEGTVTFGGGACPAVGYVYFLPVDAQDAAAAMQPRTGWARFEKDGRYRATTLVTYDGLLPGTYTVRVECHAAGDESGHDLGPSRIPAGAALPQLVVPQGNRQPIRHDIDIVTGQGGPSGAGG